MKVRIRHISPLQAGKMAAAVYGAISVLVCPFLIIAAVLAPGHSFPIFVAILLPVIYVVLGFIVGAFTAFIYNVVSEWIGGMEMEFDVIATQPPELT
jgi:ABC-type Co2+ transport system permease subunit